VLDNIERTYDIEGLPRKSHFNKIAFMNGKSAAHSGPLGSQMKGFNAEPFPVLSKRLQKKTARAAYIEDHSPFGKRLTQQSSGHTKILSYSAVFLGQALEIVFA
jgi:hypothetical protein